MPDSYKVVSKLDSLVHTSQEELVFILEGKVESLGGEVSDDIGQKDRTSCSLGI